MKLKKIFKEYTIGFMTLCICCSLIACNSDRKEKMFSGKDVYGNQVELYMEYQANGECYANFVRTINGFSSDERTHFGRAKNIATCRNINQEVAKEMSKLL